MCYNSYGFKIMPLAETVRVTVLRSDEGLGNYRKVVLPA